ncbi:alpha/beta hydrolase [Paenibacillus sp. MBLB4367]|uniref:alpha/beta hydrolase n=1 Tax=Paenibacillus sp. MBLB4367 TaxID=3384767 RepID=UPI00390820FD
MKTVTLNPLLRRFENAVKIGVRKKIRLPRWATAVALLLIMPILAFHGYIAWTLGRPAIAPLLSNPLEAIGLSYEDVTFPSANGRSSLNGWYIPGESQETVVFSHGYGANREESWVPMYELAKALNRMQYNVLMFDYGFVQPGRVVTGGIQETQELLGAISLAKTKGAQNVFVWGFSMGAGTALQAALVTKEISGMILDSTYLLDPDTLYMNVKQHVDLPRFPSLSLIRFFFPIFNGVSLSQVPTHDVKTTHYELPIYLIHSKQDSKADYQLIQELYDNQPDHEKTRLWLVPNSKHELIYRSHKKEYMLRATSFLKSLTQGAR